MTDSDRLASCDDTAHESTRTRPVRGTLIRSSHGFDLAHATSVKIRLVTPQGSIHTERVAHLEPGFHPWRNFATEQGVAIVVEEARADHPPLDSAPET